MMREFFSRTARVRPVVAAVLVLLATASAVALLWTMGQTSPSALPPPPPVAPSIYSNSRPSVSFVGVDACVECHPDQHASWTETAHSRALADIDPASEPPPGAFQHLPSGRSYEVLVEGHALRHRETVRTADGESLVLADLPLRYVMGSGRFSRSYLADRDGFLVESPVTWYAALKAWKISPGYDVHNPGFERPINGDCMGCHVGRVDREHGAVQRFAVRAQAIDCERCHGPGALHVEFRRSERGAEQDAGTGDLTIANPARMSRADREAVCAQCHLHSAATVDLRGRRRSDFRPGLKLNDFCIHYGLEAPSSEMRVVGHMEQMRLSACYRGSETLTCTTCHDPHRSPPAGQTVAYFRSKCLECHAPESCRVPRETRFAEHADDNCMSCHMPTSDTDIPHFAFTHHRIGIHSDAAESGPQPVSNLVPLTDVSHLPQIEQDRCLGLGYMQLAGTADSQSTVAAYQDRARGILEDVRARGLVDPEIDATLARLYWRIDPERTMTMAESVLQQIGAAPESRVTALFTLATSHLDRQEVEPALPLLEELVTLRLSSEDWYLLSACRQRLGDLAGALTAAQRAAEIAPQFPQLQEHLAVLLEQQGQPDAAQAARIRAALLRDSSLRSAGH